MADDPKAQIHQDRLGVLAPPISGKIYEGRVARLHPDGDPLKYPWGDEKRDQTGLEQILAELQTPRPFTLLHPQDLISRGANADVVGTVIGARLDGDHVVARILVTDQRAIAAIDAGMHELSLGYLSVLNDKGFQSDIRVDHLALVPLARCGGSCALRADCADATPCTCNNYARSYTSEIVGTSPNKDANLTAHARHELPSQMFADPKAEALPIEDEGHVKDAMSRFDQTRFKGPAERKAAYHHIIARAHQLGIDPSGFQKKYAGNLDEGNNDMDELQKKLDAALADVAAQKARADKAEQDLTAAKTALTAAEVEATNAKASLATEKTRADAALAAEKTRADAAEQAAKDVAVKAKQDSAADLANAVKSRVALETQANLILGATDKDGKTIDRSAMSDRDIKVAVIKHVDGIEIAADKEPLFIDGVFEGSKSRASAVNASVTAARSVTMPVRQDGAPVQPLPTGPDAERAERQAMANRKRAGQA